MLSKAKESTKPADAATTGSFNIYTMGTNTEKEAAMYSYDVWNQLVKTVEGDKKVQYSYNGDGLRVGKTINGQLTRYLYEADKVVLEVDGNNNQIAKNTYGTNLLTRTVDGETLNYMYNGHGDVTALLGIDGTIKASYYYDAFGNILEQTGAVNNNITFAGYQYDKETDLYYLNARYYDAKIARFMTEDTYRGQASDPLSLNLYTYCKNEPLMYWDPSGHKTMTWEGYVREVSDSEAAKAASEGWADFKGKAYCDNMYVCPGTTTTIDNDRNTKSISTGAGSNTTINNSGSINSVNTGSNSNANINNNNNAYIGTINGGYGSTLNIINNGHIGNVNTGQKSTNNISNNGSIGSIFTGDGNDTILSGMGSHKYSGGNGSFTYVDWNGSTIYSVKPITVNCYFIPGIGYTLSNEYIDIDGSYKKVSEIQKSINQYTYNYLGLTLYEIPGSNGAFSDFQLGALNGYRRGIVDKDVDIQWGKMKFVHPLYDTLEQVDYYNRNISGRRAYQGYNVALSLVSDGADLVTSLASCGVIPAAKTTINFVAKTGKYAERIGIGLSMKDTGFDIAVGDKPLDANTALEFSFSVLPVLGSYSAIDNAWNYFPNYEIYDYNTNEIIPPL